MPANLEIINEQNKKRHKRDHNGKHQEYPEVFPTPPTSPIASNVLNLNQLPFEMSQIKQENDTLSTAFIATKNQINKLEYEAAEDLAFQFQQMIINGHEVDVSDKRLVVDGKRIATPIATCACGKKRISDKCVECFRKLCNSCLNKEKMCKQCRKQISERKKMCRVEKVVQNIFDIGTNEQINGDDNMAIEQTDIENILSNLNNEITKSSRQGLLSYYFIGKVIYETIQNEYSKQNNSSNLFSFTNDFISAIDKSPLPIGFKNEVLGEINSYYKLPAHILDKGFRYAKEKNLCFYFKKGESTSIEEIINMIDRLERSTTIKRAVLSGTLKVYLVFRLAFDNPEQQILRSVDPPHTKWFCSTSKIYILYLIDCLIKRKNTTLVGAASAAA